MVIISVKNAFDVLCDDCNTTTNTEELVDKIVSHGKVCDFNWYIDNEFPDGTDIDKFANFCENHLAEILKELGIDN